MEELHYAVAGLSDGYILADHARYLVPWFEWTSRIRGKHVFREQKLSVKDVFKQKDVPRPVVESAGIDTTEFRPLEVDIITNLISGHVYSEENASALNKEGLHLLNHDSAIQRKASLQTEGNLQFKVEQRVYVDGKTTRTFANKVVSGIPSRLRQEEIKERSQ